MIWMTQSAWPSTEWNFLGHDYDTQSSFYGTQKACEPVHAQLNLEDGSVDLINLSQARSLKVRTRVVGLDGKTLSDESATVQAAADARTPIGKLDLEKIANGHAVLVKLDVTDADGKPVSDNFYWWAKQESTLQELGKLDGAKLTTTATAGAIDNGRQVRVQIKNSETVPAVLVKLTLVNAASGERILPAYYSENYVSLLPGEERTITVQFPAGSERPAVGLRGWNVASSNITVQ
jgi:hypothetical protein